MANNSLERFARRLLAVEKLAKRAATTPQLAYSSIEDGAIQSVEDGVLKGIIGKQFDGTHAVAAVNGPKPPTPLDPTVEPGIGFLKVIVADGFVDGALVPMDFARYEVHVSDEGPDFAVDLSTTLRGTVESPRGGEQIVALPYEEHWAKVVARSTSGTASDPSNAVAGTPRQILAPDLDPDLNLGGGTDGDAPASSPAATVEPFAIRSVRAHWPAVANADPVTYKVYASSSPIVAEAPEILVAETAETHIYLPATSAGLHVRVLATDADGPSPAGLGAEGFAIPEDVEPFELEPGMIEGAHLADFTIEADKIAPETITNAQIAALTITAAEIASDAITAAKIAANAVEADKILADAVTAVKIAAGAVTAIKIAAGAVETDKLAANAVTADKILANAITAVKIAAGAIETDKLAADAVTAEKIAADAVTAAHIAAEAIDATKIAAGAIEAVHIATGAIEAAHIAAGAIDADMISSGNLDADVAILGSLSIGDTELTPEGSSFVGQGTFDALDVLGNLNIRGITNFLSGLMTLSTGVSNPGQQATITSTYSGVGTPPEDDGGYYRKGLFATDTEWGWVEAPSWDDQSQVQFIAKNDSGWTFRNFLSLSGWTALGGVTKIGTRYYLLARQKTNTSNWRILIHAADGEPGRTHGEYLGSLESLGAGLGSIAPSAFPTIGTDGTDILVAWVTASGNAYVRKMDTAGGTWGLTNLDIAWNAATPMWAVQQVGSRYFVASPGKLYAFNSSTGARTTADEFPVAASSLQGAYHDGTVWHTSHWGFVVYHYTNNDGFWDFSYTWYDSDPAGSGTAESLPAPTKTVAPTKFAQWKIALPVPPPDDGSTDGANTARLYAAPMGQPLVAQATLPEGQMAVIFDSLQTSGSNPPLVSGFATRVSTAMGSIRSTALGSGGQAKIRLNGDGTWALDPTSNLNDTGWINIAASLGYAHVSGDPAQVRVIDGQVFYRGRFRRTSGTSTTVGVLPAQAIPLVGISSMIRCGNAWIPWIISASGTLVISSAVVTGDDIHVASAAGIPYLTI